MYRGYFTPFITIVGAHLVDSNFFEGFAYQATALDLVFVQTCRVLTNCPAGIGNATRSEIWSKLLHEWFSGCDIYMEGLLSLDIQITSSEGVFKVHIGGPNAFSGGAWTSRAVYLSHYRCEGDINDLMGLGLKKHPSCHNMAVILTASGCVS